MFTKLREILADFIDKQAVEQAVAQAEADVRAALTTAQAEVDDDIAQAGPAVQQAVDAVFAKLLALV